jgi:hypothetical protein
MKKYLIILAIITLLHLSNTPTYAHSGRTDSNGGHNCSASSISKGLCTGYHYHNGGTSNTSPQQLVPAATPVTVIATPKPLVATPKATIKPTVKPTPKITPTPKVSPTIAPTPTITPIVQIVPVETKKQGFFEWLFSLFSN